LRQWLRLFGDVRQGEGALVGLLGLQVFLLLVAYYLLKTVREPLILLKTLWGLKGSELRTYGTAAQALLLVGLMPLYSRAAGGVARSIVVRGSLLAIAIVTAAFIVAGLVGVPIGVPFFIWLGIVSLLSVAQFWSLANDLLDRHTGERLFGIIAIGGSLGAIAGAQLARWLIGPLGVFGLMGFATALYVGAVPIVAAVETYARRLRARRAPAGGARPAGAAADHDVRVPHTRGPFALVLSDRYLLLLGVALLLANLVNTQGEYILADTIKRHADALPPDARTAYIGRAFGNFYSAVNGIALIIQALFVSRLLKHVGIRSLLFVLPVVALGGYGVIALYPMLAVVVGVKLAENALDYSLLNTVRHALFLPTSRGAKYAGKAAIDTVFVRLGDLVAGGVVFAGLHVLHLSRSGFAAVNVVLAAMWTVSMIAIARRHAMLVGADNDVPGPPWRARLAAPAALLLAAFIPWGCAHSPPAVRAFPDRPVAWHEHDDADVARPPVATELEELDITMLLRDSVAGEVDYYLTLEGTRPARDINALDEVPCSTWFCPRNHLQPMTVADVAVGAPGAPPRLPLRIVKGKVRGAAFGFEAVDADGRKFMVKPDPEGHPGMASSAEIVGARIFHAAGYNVPSSFVLDLDPNTDIELDPKATFKLYDVERRPLTMRQIRAGLAHGARTADGRVRVVAISWVPGRVLGAFDLVGQRPDDPNDRIPHQHRRSLRASLLLVAWLAIHDAGFTNTLDSYVDDGGRHFVRHHFIDFGAGLGSATNKVKGLYNGQERYVEVGRTLAAWASLGLYRRPYQDQRDSWQQMTATHPAVGWYPAETFDPDQFRTGRKVPAHRRMTDRDAYWGAKLVTSFTDAQLAAIVGEARLPDSEAAYLTYALRARRDIIGRRYMRAATAIEAPRVAGDGRRRQVDVCFDDLAVARGYVDARELRYAVTIRDDAGRAIGTGDVAATASRASACVALDAAGAQAYRIVEVTSELRDDSGGVHRAKPARIHVAGARVVGLERDD